MSTVLPVAPKTWKTHEPFGLPPGSVRAILALAIIGGICSFMIFKPTIEVPQHFRDLMFIVLGYYFAARGYNPIAYDLAPGEKIPNPLYLPKGTIRTLLVLIFFITGCVLFARNHIWMNGGLSGASISLLLVAGFLGGVVVKGILPAKPPTRKAETIKAFIALCAAAFLIAMMLDKIDGTTISLLAKEKVRSTVEKSLTAVVGFYFGSRR
jgi:hypothetical protein